MEEDIALGDTSNLLSLKQTVESSKNSLWLKHSFREKTRNQKKTTKCFVRQSYTASTSVKQCWVNQKSYHFERSIWNNTTARFIVWLPEEIFEVIDEPLVTSIRHFKYPNIQEKLHANYDPLGQKYLKAILSGKKAVNVDMYMKFISATRER